MINKPLVGVAAGVLLAASGVWYFIHNRSSDLPNAPIAAAPPEPPAIEHASIQHPVPPPAATAEPAAVLPTLEQSDAPLTEALVGAMGEKAASFFVPLTLIRHLVVTVDNLPRPKVAVDRRPTIPVAGSFIADGDELHAAIDARNYARYQPLVEALRGLDMQRVAAVYFRFYPLFQTAYQDLGYPNGYFNDRLVQVIDVLLKTPQPTGPLELVRPNVMYTFADPELEARPAGQKILLRMGPDNAAAVKAKLLELRAVVTAAPPKP